MAHKELKDHCRHLVLVFIQTDIRLCTHKLRVSIQALSAVMALFDVGGSKYLSHFGPSSVRWVTFSLWVKSFQWTEMRVK